MKSEKWCTKPLRELISFIGKGITPKYSDDKENSIVVLNQKCNRNNKIDLSFARYNNLDKKKVSEERMLKKYDILINSTGTGTAGRVAQIKDVFEDMTVDSHMIILRNNDLIVPQYLGYALIKNQRIIESLAEGSTGQTEINKQRLLDEILISYPINKEEQKAIVSILSALDEKIELNQQINNNLEQQAQAIFKSWFVDFELFGGVIPSNWKKGILGDFVEIKRGASPRPIQEYIADKGYYWLKISDVTNISSPFIFEIKECIKESGLRKTVFLKKGSLVLSNSATPGIPKILDIDCCIHDGWLYFLNSKLSNEYLYLFFKYIRSSLVSLGNGSIFTNLKTDIVKNFLFNFPDSKTLNEFNNIVKPIFENILFITRQNKNLVILRDTLLPKLMSGEIDISNIITLDI